jgi:hypothetical protein
MATVQLAGNGFGGVVQGNYGTYEAASDGTFTVDTRDAPQMLTLGMTYLKQVVNSYAVPIAAPAATVGGVVSSGALSNGTVSVTTQPTVMRPVTVEVGTGTTAITAGNIAVTYVGNDAQVTTDNFTAVCALSSATTQTTSKGVVSISSIVVTGLVGGTSPWFRSSTTATLAVPVSEGAVDFGIIREYDAGATIAVGTVATSLGCITPTTAPNGTVTYTFVYDYISPNI